MDNLLTLALEAHNDTENHHRRYVIEVGQDLFKEWTLAVRYGRVGTRGQEQQFAVAEESELSALIQDRLRRRLNAKKRIGCPYRLVELDIAEGHDCSDWLPVELVMNFRQAV